MSHVLFNLNYVSDLKQIRLLIDCCGIVSSSWFNILCYFHQIIPG